jgi:hypothetical protein
MPFLSKGCSYGNVGYFLLESGLHSDNQQSVKRRVPSYRVQSRAVELNPLVWPTALIHNVPSEKLLIANFDG